ncbi:MAG: site-2 protease family protein [Verrucomicrobiota bacterium]
MDPNHLRDGIIFYLILLGSLSVHEWAHAYAADKLGDNTPRSQGRVTLNPVSHIDPLGTVAIPLIMILLNPGFAIFGWGKPVMVDPRNFKKLKRDDIIVSMAGPASNLAIGLITAVIGGLIMRFVPEFGDLVVRVIMVNAILIVFNLIPIPPLDGSHILKHAINMRDETYIKLSAYGFIILIVLINLPPFRIVMGTAIYFVTGAVAAIAQIIAGG